MKYYDERNTLFSRISLKKGSKEYNEFYKKNPSLKESDDQYRGTSFRNNLRKSDRFKDLFFPITASNKTFIKSLHEVVDKTRLGEMQNIKPSFAKNIKEITKYYGATEVGITTLDEYSYYSHFGGLNDELGIYNYGEKPTQKYTHAVVFTIAMDLEKMNRAPHFEELLATEEAYLMLAHVGARLAVYLKSIGYDSMFNSSEFYLAPLVPLAYDAGLGQIGMSNHLVTVEHGDNVRLGAVFTTLKLDIDKPIDFGLDDFCKRCSLCLMNCPSHAISHKPRMVNGRQFYKFDDQKCFDMWVKSGTDCGTCIQACPFTQGIDLKKIPKIKEGTKEIDEIMSEHMDKYGRRNYIKKEHRMLMLEEDDES